MNKQSNNSLETQTYFENNSFAFIDNCILQFIKKIKMENNISLINWEPKNKNYPEYLLLSGDKGILAYVDFYVIKLLDDDLSKSLETDSFTLLNQILIADTQLDRPIFFVYIIETKNKKHVLFETNEQIKDRWLADGLHSPVYTPIVDEMGDLDNLISIWTSMKKSSARKKR